MSSYIQRAILSCAFLLLCLSSTNAYKFLGILPTSSRSHYNVGSALFKGLARKGHDVTVISAFPLKKPMENYHDIPCTKAIEAMATIKETNFLNLLDNSIVENIIFIHKLGLQFSSDLLEEPEVKALLQTNQTFDAVLCEVFLSESLFGFSEHFNAPLIGIGTFGAHPWNTDMIGSPSPPSYVPSAMLPFTDRMTLTQRLANLAYTIFERILIDYFYLPHQEALYKEHFPNNKRSIHEIRKNAALVLLNQHVSLTSPRPYMPNHIEVGGMHINRKGTPLPADIQKFIDEAEHGVIYFSMGSALKSTNLPIAIREEMVKAFRGLKQRVLWKFEEKLANKPKNVFISDWFPQDDILAHKNVRAFVTHGGLLSTTESIYHGKPFIGLPVFGDQFLNMARAEKNGYGILFDYRTLTADKFKAALESIVEEPKYTQKVRDMSARYRDQPMEPLELAIYWVEHVVRHKGADYLHCAGQDLNFIQYHSIDTILILSAIVLAVILVTMWLLRIVWRLLSSVLCGKKVPPKQKRH